MTPESLLLVGMEHRKPNHFGCLRQKMTSYRKWEGMKHERQGTLPLECCSLWPVHGELTTLAVFGYHEPGCWHWPGYMTPTMGSWLNTSQWLFSRISAWKYPPWLKNIEQVEPHSIATWWLKNLGSVDLNWPLFAGQGRRRDRRRLRKQICNAGHIPDFCLPSTLHPLGHHSSSQDHGLPLDDSLCCYPVSCKMTLALADLIPLLPKE